MSAKKAAFNLMFWVALAILFNLGIYIFLGQEKAFEFLGGYIIEQSLSLDNLFLFLIIFSSFGLQRGYQKRVLDYGIFGAIILRLIFIFLGVTVVNKFNFILYVFGIVLIISGIKMLIKEDEVRDVRQSKLITLFKKVMPVTDKLEGDRFFVRKNKVLYATPLMAILVLIEGSDILFAIDSIPAIFSITTDPFIVYTSNIFAILGLRSMYFFLERVNEIFRYVKYGVALILVFTGIKLFILLFHLQISLIISLAIIFSILLLSVLASIFIKQEKEEESVKEKIL